MLFFLFIFKDLSSKICLGFFLLESPNILLNRTNYGVKFNFISIKKKKNPRVFPTFF